MDYFEPMDVDESPVKEDSVFDVSFGQENVVMHEVDSFADYTESTFSANTFPKVNHTDNLLVLPSEDSENKCIGIIGPEKEAISEAEAPAAMNLPPCDAVKLESGEELKIELKQDPKEMPSEAAKFVSIEKTKDVELVDEEKLPQNKSVVAAEENILNTTAEPKVPCASKSAEEMVSLNVTTDLPSALDINECSTKYEKPFHSPPDDVTLNVTTDLPSAQPEVGPQSLESTEIQGDENVALNVTTDLPSAQPEVGPQSLESTEIQGEENVALNVMTDLPSAQPEVGPQSLESTEIQGEENVALNVTMDLHSAQPEVGPQSLESTEIQGEENVGLNVTTDMPSTQPEIGLKSLGPSEESANDPAISSPIKNSFSKPSEGPTSNKIPELSSERDEEELSEDEVSGDPESNNFCDESMSPPAEESPDITTKPDASNSPRKLSFAIKKNLLDSSLIVASPLKNIMEPLHDMTNALIEGPLSRGGKKELKENDGEGENFNQLHSPNKPPSLKSGPRRSVLEIFDPLLSSTDVDSPKISKESNEDVKPQPQQIIKEESIAVEELVGVVEEKLIVIDENEDLKKEIARLRSLRTDLCQDILILKQKKAEKDIIHTEILNRNSSLKRTLEYEKCKRMKNILTIQLDNNDEFIRSNDYLRKDVVELKRLLELTTAEIEKRDSRKSELEKGSLKLRQQLSNLEDTFSRVHTKYENIKELLRKHQKWNTAQQLTLSEEICAKYEARNKNLESHFNDKMSQINSDLEDLNLKHKQLKLKLTAKVKHLEIRNASQEDALERKSKECTELTLLVDQLTGSKI